MIEIAIITDSSSDLLEKKVNSFVSNLSEKKFKLISIQFATNNNYTCMIQFENNITTSTTNNVVCKSCNQKIDFVGDYNKIFVYSNTNNNEVKYNESSSEYYLCKKCIKTSKENNQKIKQLIRNNKNNNKCINCQKDLYFRINKLELLPHLEIWRFENGNKSDEFKLCNSCTNLINAK